MASENANVELEQDLFENGDDLDEEDPNLSVQKLKDTAEMELEELLEHMGKMTIALRLIAALDQETLHSGDPNGATIFKKILSDLRSSEEDDEDIKAIDLRTIEKIMEIIITLDRVDLIDAVFNHPRLPHVTASDAVMIASLRKSIRTGKLNVLNFLIDKNVQLFSKNDNRDKEMQGLMFQIVKAVEIGHTKQRLECFKAAEVFFNYFLRKCYEFTFQQNINEIAVATIPTTQTTLSEKACIDEEKNMRHRIGMELRNSLVKMPLIQQSIISAFRQLGHTPKYFSHCFIHLEFIREKYVLFRIPEHDKIKNNENENKIGLQLEMDTATSYEKPLILKIDENYRGLEWNIFWMQHLLSLLKSIYRHINSLERKQKMQKLVNSSGNADEQSTLSKYRQPSMEDLLKENINDMAISVDYLISGGVPFIQQMKEVIVSVSTDTSSPSFPFKSSISSLLLQHVQQGCNNWNLKNLSILQMQRLFAHSIKSSRDEESQWSEMPTDLIKFILTFVTL